MRKTTHIFFVLLCLCNITAWAQPQNFGDPLIISGDQIASPYSDKDEGTGDEHGLSALCDNNPDTWWHSDWHGEHLEEFHWVQFELPELTEGPMVMWIKRRNHSLDMAKKVVLTGSLTSDFVVPVPIDTLELGNLTAGADYVTDMWSIPEPVKYIRFTVIEKENSQNDEHKFWHMSEINFYHADEFEMLLGQINELLVSYGDYLWGTPLNIGTEAGQFTDQASADMFVKNLQYMSDISDGMVEAPSNDEIRVLIEETKVLYKKYKDSQVPYVPQTNGYYRIISNLDYYTNEETGELDEFGEPVTKRVYGKKSMYANLEGSGRWHTLDPKDCRDVWYITVNENKTVNIKNVATEMNAWEVTSGSVTLHEDAEDTPTMTLDWAGVENEHTVFYIRCSAAEKENCELYLHQQYHSQGIGEEGPLCGWKGTFNMGVPYESDKGTSEWYLEPVPEEEALRLIEDFSIIKNHDLMVSQYRELETQAKNDMTIAQDVATEGIITSASQFSSMVTEPKEGSFDNLLDDDSNSFWHSNWSDGNRPMGTHFFDVTVNEPVEGEVRLWVQRRGNADYPDNPTLWGIYGSNDENALNVIADFENSEENEWPAQTVAGWELIIDSLATPWVNAVKVATSDFFKLTTPYKYLRFVCKETQGPSNPNRGYFHMGGFQIEKVIGTRQIDNMGEIGANMLAELEKAASTADADLTIDDLNRLKDAYEAFKEILADPTELRNAIEKYKNYSKMLVIGDEPGFWTDDAQAIALNEQLATADSYYKAGIFDKVQLETQTTALNDAADAFLNAAHKINTDKWYRIRFANEETYTTNNWNQGNIHPAEGAAANLGDLWGQYATIGMHKTTEEFAEAQIIEDLQTDAMREGDAIYFAPLENISNEDAALFRFVNIGDSAYIIQNKATGLFINCEGRNNNNVTMSLNPTTFQVNAIGYGAMLMAGKKLNGEDVTNLHAQCWNHRLVTWESSNPESNSGLLIETATDVTSDVANSFVRDMQLGQIYTYCHPTAVKATDSEVGLYTVAGTYTDGEDSYYVALNTITETEPGMPYLAIASAPADYEETAESVTDPYPFEQVFTGFAVEAGSVNGLTGTYSSVTAELGNVIFSKNQAVTCKDEVIDNGDGTFTSVTNRNVRAYTAYLKYGTTEVEPDGEYDLVIKIEGKPIAVNIDCVLDRVARNGQLFDLSGRLLKKNATLNDVKAFGHGMYILNGVKIMVK